MIIDSFDWRDSLDEFEWRVYFRIVSHGNRKREQFTKPFAKSLTKSLYKEPQKSPNERQDFGR